MVPPTPLSRVLCEVTGPLALKSNHPQVRQSISMRNSTRAKPVCRCEDRLAIDLKGLGPRVAAGAILSVHWRAEGARRQAQLYMEDDGLRIEYGSSDPDGRWLHCIGTELAPWHLTPQHLGGCRRWLGCPGCGRRCRALYHGDTVLRCRLCLGLRRRGDQRLDLLESCSPMPRGVRRRTYQRLVAMDEALGERRVNLILGRFLKHLR